MMVGNKSREIKSIMAKNMVDRLNMTLSGYQRIERDEVSVNIERLLEIAGIFEMKPEDVLTFEEKLDLIIMERSKEKTAGSASIILPTTSLLKMKQLYEDKIKLQADLIALF